jgi:two-component system response regulator
VEDSPADVHLVQRALKHCGLTSELCVVRTGREALDYLYATGRYAGACRASRPDLVLLDLNLPELDGREVLRRIKNDPQLHTLPVIILSSSERAEDILETYALGTNTYIAKPDNLAGFTTVIQAVMHYWADVARLPGRTR